MTPPADDLVRRLNAEAERWGPHHKVLYETYREAADALAARDQRIAALEGEVERFRDANGVDIYIADAEAAERRAEADAADAQRYRWLRSAIEREEFAGSAYISIRQDDEWDAMQPQQLDAAIDAAIAAGDGK